jgi:hypothetical protein
VLSEAEASNLRTANLGIASQKTLAMTERLSRYPVSTKITVLTDGHGNIRVWFLFVPHLLVHPLSEAMTQKI